MNGAPRRPSLALKREPQGYAATPVPFDASGAPDWRGFEQILRRVHDAGLRPAVNVLVGHVEHLDVGQRLHALYTANRLLGHDFAAGVHLADSPGEPFSVSAYRRQLGVVAERCAMPILLPTWGLAALDADQWQQAHLDLSQDVDQFLASQTSPALDRRGRLDSDDTFVALLRNKRCAGIVHTELARNLLFDRVERRNRLRPDFGVYSANERALDMVAYGCDYVSVTAAVAPSQVARRDRLWASGDRDFHQANDELQAIGSVLAREPHSGVAHGTLLALAELRVIDHAGVPPGAQRRPNAEAEVLLALLETLPEITANPDPKAETPPS